MKTPEILAYMITIMMTALVAALFIIEIPESNEKTVYALVGSLTTVWVGAMQFFHGATIKENKK